ncbi:MAG: hypothetical protein HYX76_02040 [Acidobacteria bacterium]|nr:hypothetical protein [Acidobacteriota bacterium]
MKRGGSTLEAARAAKEKVFPRLTSLPDVNGVGIARVGNGYGVKVNAARELRDVDVPDEVDGVPIVVEVVGPVSKRQGR